MLDRDHIREIDAVLSGGQGGRDAVVTQSWRRCVEQYGLDPTRPSPAHIVTETRLREHREQAERLIAIARSGLEALFRQIAGQNYVLMLADAQGVTVDYFGDPRFEEDLRRAGLYLGADWSEDLAGTCGIGSCLVTGEPVTIHQTDHFDLTHTRLSCTAAPIFDASGVLAAVLDISLLRSPQPKISQSLAMNLVRTSARRIEMANLMALTRSDWVLRFSAMPEFLDVDPEAAVALDGTGRIIGLTRGAQQALSPDGRPVLGERLDSLIELSIDDLPELMRGRPTEDRLIRLRDGQAMFGHAIAPQRGPLPRSGPAPELPAALRTFGGEDPAIRRLLAQAARLAPTGIPLLIRGETGTGKERLARAIHDCQPSSRPFVQASCAVGPGAEDAHMDGLRAALRAARGGTLLLDGLDDLPRASQGGLLRLLAESETQAFGRVRLVSTVRQDLAEAVGQGRFREDLFFRLAGATLAVPPLRLRQDFDWLLDRLLRQRTHSSADSYRLSPAARAQLKSRPWPGNVRELMSLLDVAVALAEAPVIDLPDLPPAAMPDRPAGPATEEGLEAVLAACGWNMACAARRLGVDRSTVLRRARRLGLGPPPRR